MPQPGWIHQLPAIATEQPVALAPDEVHLWYARTEVVQEPGLRRAYEALLTADERERYQRYVFDRHRLEYLVTRALVRTVLSRYAPVAPADWRFATNRYGRPQITGAPAGLGLGFNLSNTQGLVACAVARGHDVGVDVEHTSRTIEVQAIAQHSFAPAEVRALFALPPERWQQRFFAYWTLKESYIKARGMGLSIPLEQFAFDLEGSDIRIAFDPRMGDEPSAWRSLLVQVSAEHLLAASVRRPLPGPAVWRARQCVPLADG